MSDTPISPNADMPETTLPPAVPGQTVPRHTFNYLIIAVVCFVLGAVIGVVGYDRVNANTTAQVDAAVNRALATAGSDLPDRILPALGLMMCLSTMYYAWLAYRLAQKTGRTG